MSINALQGVDALMSGFHAGVEAIADRRYESGWMGRYNGMVRRHNSLADQFNRLAQRFNQLLTLSERQQQRIREERDSVFFWKQQAETAWAREHALTSELKALKRAR